MTRAHERQLQMIWPEDLLSSPPDVVLPPDYGLRTFQRGDELAYLELMAIAGFTSSGGDPRQSFLKQTLPESCFLAVYEPTGQLVASAVANHCSLPQHPFGGELGWVAAHPEHSGNGLGRAVSAAATSRLIEIGYRRIFLRTDDHRLPAIKTYLKLGYVPFLFAPDMEARWKAICARLGWPFTVNEWPGYRSPTDESPLGERPDADKIDRYPWRHVWLPGRPHRGFALMGDVDAFGDESLYHPSQLGTVSVSPSRLVAGQTMPLHLTYTAGPAGLPEGCRLTYVMRGQQPLGRLEADYTLEGPGCCMLVPADRGFGFWLQKGSLQQGQKVDLKVEAFEWTPLAGRREFKVVINRGDGRPEVRLPEPVVIDVMPARLCRLEALVPCTRRRWAAVVCQVTARDAYDNRILRTGSVTFEADGGARDVCMVAGIGRGRVDVATEPVLRVAATLPGSELRCVSNPCVESPDLQLYVGDLHCHDFMSEAEGYPDEVYRWAIEDRRLDFASVVPQAHGWLDNQTWTVAKYMSERYLNEGRFVTFLGFEWQHSGYGDKVIHYLGGDQPYLPVDDRRYATPAKLYEALRASDALVIGHHPAYPLDEWVPGTDFDCVEADVERLIELWSMHGSSEGYDPADRPLVGEARRGGVMEALRQGLRLGFVAGSDTHSGRPGGSAREPRPYWGGLTGVWAERLSRRDLFAALWARRTYALTGARIVLRVMVNGAWMGSELPVSDRAEIQIDAWAPGTIGMVELLKNTRVIRRFEPNRDECHIEIEDQTGGAAFYHCRITQTDGQLAVSSPVWIG